MRRTSFRGPLLPLGALGVSFCVVAQSLGTLEANYQVDQLLFAVASCGPLVDRTEEISQALVGLLNSLA